MGLLRPSAALIVFAVLVASCSMSAPSAVRRSRQALGPVPMRSRTPPTTSTTTTIAPTTTTTTEQPGWTPVSTVNGAIAVDSRALTGPAGGVVSLFRFRAGPVRFALHVGSTDPPGAAARVAPDNGPSVGPDEAPVLLAAFNGGFQTSTGAGGFQVGPQVFVPLQTGVASLVIDTDGSAHVGVWGEGVPAPGEAVADVRQNLRPLVAGGQPSPAVSAVSAWGATLGGGAEVARSALGEDTAGNLIYAGSMHAVPGDLAGALVDVGTVTAMELDINPEWVQLAVAGTPGAPLTVGVTGQNRPADQYQVGWTRDFVTVTAVG